MGITICRIPDCRLAYGAREKRIFVMTVTAGANRMPELEPSQQREKRDDS